MSFWQKGKNQNAKPAPDPPVSDPGDAPPVAPPRPDTGQTGRWGSNRTPDMGQEPYPIKRGDEPILLTEPDTDSITAPAFSTNDSLGTTQQLTYFSELEIQELLHVLRVAARGDFAARMRLPEPADGQRGTVYEIQSEMNRLLTEVQTRISVPPAINPQTNPPIVPISVTAGATANSLPVAAVSSPVPIPEPPQTPSPPTWGTARPTFPAVPPLPLMNQSPLASLLDAQERLDEVTALFMELYEHLHTTTSQLGQSFGEVSLTTASEIPVDISEVEQKIRLMVLAMERVTTGLRYQIEVAVPMADRLHQFAQGSHQLGESVRIMQMATDDLKRLMSETATLLSGLRTGTL